MNAIITVVGQDSKGIIAKVSAKCADAGANILEISQSILKDYFAMIMVVDISEINMPYTKLITPDNKVIINLPVTVSHSMPFTAFVDDMTNMGVSEGLDIRTMHEDIFNSMHRI